MRCLSVPAPGSPPPPGGGAAAPPPLSATSAARAVVAVRGLHRFALLDGLVPDDVAHEVRPPTPARRLPKAIPVESVVALIEAADRKSTRLNSSHANISYAVFCLKKKKRLAL